MKDIIKDKRLLKLIDMIQTLTKDTIFENRVFLVGGCLRDSILKRPIHDVDIIVEKEQGGLLFSTFLAMRNKCYVYGKNPVVFPTYGTAKVQLYNDEDLKDLHIECVESRSSMEFQTYGTIEQDCLLRDLTINSLYYNIGTEQLYDFSNTAVSDFQNKTLRTYSDVNLTFVKDPIKMLRIIRFSAELGWGIEKDTWLGIIKYAHKIRSVPQEKVTNELTKILLSDNPSIGLTKLYTCGMLDKLMPDVYDMTKGYESKNPAVTIFEHMLKVLETTQPYIESRLAALFHDVGRIITDYDRTISPDNFSAEIAEHELKRMKYPTQVIESVKKAIRYHRAFSQYQDGVTPPDKRIRKFMDLCGDDVGTVVDLMNANNVNVTYGKKKTQVLLLLNRIEEIEKENESLNVKLPINGNDIIKEFKVKGPIVGIILERCKDAYFENPNITKEECIEIGRNEISKTYAYNP